MKNSARGAEPEVRASLAKLEGRVLDRQLPSPANPTVCTLTMMATCCLSPSHSRLRWTRSSNLNATLRTTPNLAPTFRHSPSYRLFRLTRRMETCTNLRMVTTKPPADRSGSLFGPRGVQRRHRQTNANRTGHWQTKARAGLTSLLDVLVVRKLNCACCKFGPRAESCARLTPAFYPALAMCH